MSNKKKVFLPVLLVAVVGVVLLTASKNSHAGDHTGTIIWDGLNRTYMIHIPPSHDKTKPVPLVIALHGGGASGKNMVNLTLGGFNTLADKEDFIVVYPDAVERQWNDGRTGVKYRFHKIEQINDVSFISALIDHLIKEYNIDNKRVYVTGMSNGAIMTYRLGCELVEKITAIAPVDGLMVPSVTGKAKPARPISVLIMNNVKDPAVPWEGGEIGFPGYSQGKRGKGLSVAESVKFWVNHNQCLTPPTITLEEDRDPNDGTRVRKEIYTNREGVEVILYAIEGGGHTWPGGRQYLPEKIIGKTSRDINANDVIWDFFKKHAIR